MPAREILNVNGGGVTKIVNGSTVLVAFSNLRKLPHSLEHHRAMAFASPQPSWPRQRAASCSRALRCSSAEGGQYLNK